MLLIAKTRSGIHVDLSDDVSPSFCSHSVFLPITVELCGEIALSNRAREVMERVVALVAELLAKQCGLNGSDVNEVTRCVWEVGQLSLCCRELLVSTKGVMSSFKQKVILLHGEYVERQLQKWSELLVFEHFENLGIPIRAADVTQERLAECHARAQNEWLSLLSGHPRLARRELRNMLDDVVDEAESRWQMLRLRNLNDINYVFEAQQLGVTLDLGGGGNF